MSDWVLGVIGGSGLYDIPGLNGVWRAIESPWGQASDQIFDGELDGQRVVFLPRHGRGHAIAPSDINGRANIDVLKRAGVTDVLSISAVGSLKAELPPGHFVVVDQYIDRTFARAKSFFGKGLVAHVSVAHPTCPRLRALAGEAARRIGAQVTEGGTYVVMEGPQFSTLAESQLYRSWGCSVIGMTNMPEAKLAREAELPYASICMVTDYDCWNEGHGAVEVSAIIEVMHANSAKAKHLVAELARAIKTIPRTPSPIDTCLDFAVITEPEARDLELVKKLSAIAGRVLN
ncbi:S-methyl-5'-thioadenosine phosphorylase [Candidatus Phycosocius spiralis]|uniref:S-methyl-5'-thioadenosine phosphorylase n=1 Tax=Candidatus Phycosocius spiralis TaxID=2815099 RepID=A0ABQ4PV86_9PROT|nr:S-methyl-5'-thioadenosine phosphorylase [Candidatus Phycosocius spiralis]GIU66845.1 S-methyl-5'-thioadenosine phosphorylase [Candidatus Phycosocius spiralis]